MLSAIALDRDNRMLRIGFGKHNGQWFWRVDLWSIGLRWNQNSKPDQKGSQS